MTQSEVFSNYMEKVLDKSHWLESTKSTFIVVDKHLNILYHNNKEVCKVKDKFMQPGDFLHCTNAIHSKEGCGTSEYCADCQLRNSVKKALTTSQSVNEEVVLTLDDNQKLILQETATPFEFEGNQYAAIFVINISDRKQEQMLERVFFHDMMNLVGALSSFVDILKETPEQAILDEVKKLTDQIMDELSTQKELLYAENGILTLQTSDITVKEFLSYAAYSLCPMAETKKHKLTICNNCKKDIFIHTDTKLLHRIILNMVKNAVEASEENSIVTLTASSAEKSVLFSVNNPNVIPEDFRGSIFHFGLSTKGEGRGIGTYSMKLFGENYLKGKVWFITNETEGTTFYFQMPLTTKY
ncbi:sensor histidine kinase KdpD [Bacteroides helcogenes]|uniref:Histidine kinase n=1 Tax=Bacteroides helcogenes (strain ATCC 35417 / DSM 20613 / JCM 6297 / CCUG 15421 / P 36-108) TaxID=693979 RepID=E6SVK6_BACT6|nr:sensor histidine kinase [Bacteroides helcogenes]ADV43467.1 histidine kinase [Bacteroides helcogenes P 36-108]MDY5239044.1 sensor histidine kinase [Bacteroides helcogenes]